jgi:hypothetical protein
MKAQRWGRGIAVFCHNLGFTEGWMLYDRFTPGKEVRGQFETSSNTNVPPETSYLDS